MEKIDSSEVFADTLVNNFILQEAGNWNSRTQLMNRAEL